MWHFVSAAEPRARRAMIVPDHSSHEISLINPSFSKKAAAAAALSCVAAIWNRDWTLNGAEKK